MSPRVIFRAATLVILGTVGAKPALSQSPKTWLAAEATVTDYFQNSFHERFKGAVETKSENALRAEKKISCSGDGRTECLLKGDRPAFMVHPSRIKGDSVEIFLTVFENMARPNGEPGKKMQVHKVSFITWYRGGKWTTPVPNYMSDPN